MAIVVTEQGRVGVATGDQRGQREGGLPDPAEEVVAHGTASSPAVDAVRRLPGTALRPRRP